MSGTISETEQFSALTVQDHKWGCAISGTRIQIIAAGIVPLEKWPTFTGDQATFEGKWEIAGRLRKVSIEKNYCPTDTTPGEVWVKYHVTELDCLPRVNKALEKLTALQQEILHTVDSVKPLPLSQILAIPGARILGKDRDSTDPHDIAR